MLSSITFGACSARNPRKTSSGCATFGRQPGWNPAGMIPPSRSAKHILPGATVRLPCPGSRECLWHTSVARRQVSPRECATSCAMTLLALKPRSRACSCAVRSTAGVLLVSRPQVKGRLRAGARGAAVWPRGLRTCEPPASLPSLKPEALARLERVKMRLDLASLHPFPETSAPIATQAVSPSGPGQSPLPQALSRRAQHSQLHLTRGRGFLAAGKLDDAKREFTEAVHLAPLTSAAAHQGLAEIYGRQGRTDDAVRELRAALASRDDADLPIQLARLYMSQKRPGETPAELQAAVQLHATPKLQEEARQLLQQLEATNGPGEPR